MSCNPGSGVGGRRAGGQGVGPAKPGLYADRLLSPLISRLLMVVVGGGEVENGESGHQPPSHASPQSC